MKRLLRLCLRESLKRFRGLGLGRIPLVRPMERMMRSALKTDCAVVLGHTMYLDAQDVFDLAMYGRHEPFETELVQQEVKAGNTVLDVGAHIGYYTLIFAKLAGTQGKVFAFEPEPENFCLLQKNVRQNGYQNVALMPKAVSDKVGKASLYLSANNSGDHRICDSREARGTIEIETVSLDDYFKDYKRTIDFVKMDIQGAEYAALCGMTTLLETDRVMRLMTEFWPHGLRTYGIQPSVFLSFLADRGFRLLDVDEEQRRVVPASVAELMERYTRGVRSYTNILCVRGEDIP